MIVDGQCPLCDWNGRTNAGKQDEATIQTYVAKALMQHLRLKHARHDERQVEAGDEQMIGFSTILSSRTHAGMIEFSLNETMSQWDLDKAREIHRMLGEAIEAAVSDTLIYQFLRQKIGLSDEAASRALLDFRELRQGSRDVVHPS